MIGGDAMELLRKLLMVRDGVVKCGSKALYALQSTECNGVKNVVLMDEGQCLFI